MHNIKLIVVYDGQAYLGWQKTSIGPSIEETLQKVLEKILQQPVTLQAASRTDAGVHAQGQVVNFLMLKPHPNLTRLKISLNRLLPKDIAVLSVEEMPLSFHPTLDCKEKEYRYFICHGAPQLPHHRFYSWYIPHLLNVEAIRQALPYLKGCHNFSAFCNTKNTTHYKDFIRKVREIEIVELNSQRIQICVRGNHFLYKMVRNLVGTLVDIGKGKIKPEAVPTILQQGDRQIAGVTAPAHGLFLYAIYYEA